MPKVVSHEHLPIFRVRRPNQDPLDSSWSSQPGIDNRWNTEESPALYCCCSVEVARAIVDDLFDFGGIVLGDLAPSVRPRLFELQWQGDVVDVTSEEGIREVGFNADYPEGEDKTRTRALAAEWHEAGLEGVMCRSASLARLGLRAWHGSHERWGEVTVFVERTKSPPKLLKASDNHEWLTARTPST